MSVFAAWDKEVTAVECNALQHFRGHFDSTVTALYAFPSPIDSSHAHTEANPSPARYFLTPFVSPPRLELLGMPDLMTCYS